MTNDLHLHSAEIIPFPPARPARRPSQSTRLHDEMNVETLPARVAPRIAMTAGGSGWYHEAAMLEDADRLR